MKKSKNYSEDEYATELEDEVDDRTENELVAEDEDDGIYG